MPTQLPALIFDLDGTLTDSMPGIVGCLRKVLDARKMGDCGPLERFVGPPVEEWTQELLPQASEEEHSELAAEYRALYGSEGWMNNTVYPGIESLLKQLRDEGFPLYVCTSKQQHFALRILDKFELSHWFTAIYGDKAEYPSHSKVDLLARLLKEGSINVEDAWMVGDRIYDFRAARTNGVSSIAAAWGYGNASEYAEADVTAKTPLDVLAIAKRTRPRPA